MSDAERIAREALERLRDDERMDCGVSNFAMLTLDKMGSGGKPAPIPMRLVCEGCGELHIDIGEFAAKPHHTHSCQHCGLTWRPAVGFTVGVRFLPGFKNAPQTTGERP